MLIFISVCNDATQLVLPALKFVEIGLCGARVWYREYNSQVCWRQVNSQELLPSKEEEGTFDSCFGCDYGKN